METARSAPVAEVPPTLVTLAPSPLTAKTRTSSRRLPSVLAKTRTTTPAAVVLAMRRLLARRRASTLPNRNISRSRTKSRTNSLARRRHLRLPHRPLYNRNNILDMSIHQIHQSSLTGTGAIWRVTLTGDILCWWPVCGLQVRVDDLGKE